MPDTSRPACRPDLLDASDTTRAGPLGRPGHERSQRLRNRVEHIARSQLGVISLLQARAAGATEEWIEWQVGVGFLTRCDVGVLHLAGLEETWKSRAMRACLARGPHAVLSFGTAARVRDLELGLWPEKRLEVSVPRSAGARSTELIRVHLTSHLGSSDRCWWGCLPLTTVARTILDLAGAGLPQHRLGRLIDDAVLSKKTTVVLLQSILSRSRRRGVRGVQAVDRALQPWLNGGVESHAEAQVLRLLLAAGFRAPVCQHEIRDGAVFVARVDFAWPAQRVVLEVDGFQYHDGPAKFVEDRHRANRLAALGWSVITTTLRELRSDPTAVFTALAAALDGLK